MPRIIKNPGFVTGQKVTAELVSDVVDTAIEAYNNSTTAIGTANTASSNASAAVSTANTANTSANSAVSTANAANTNASNAVSIASAASTTANTANTNASAAQTAATQAAQSAQNAEISAQKAEADANTAQAEATKSANEAKLAREAAQEVAEKGGTRVFIAGAEQGEERIDFSSDPQDQIDLKANIADVPTSTTFNTHANDMTKHIADSERADWNNRATIAQVATKLTIPTGTATQVLNGQGVPVASPKTYDAIIRTQEEFDALIASPTWLGAQSVALIGDGGTLEFKRIDGYGITIPSTVFTITGFNNAKIRVENFDHNKSKAGLAYTTLPSLDVYSISGISLHTSSGTGFYYYGMMRCRNVTNCISNVGEENWYSAFFQCTNLINCTVESFGKNAAFDQCNNLTSCSCDSDNNSSHFANCIGVTNCTGKGNGTIFSSCYKLTNCTASTIGYSTATGSGNAFSYCFQLTDCEGRGSGNAFSNCSQLTNCDGIGYGTGATSGYTFYNCSFLSSCKEGGTSPKSGSGIWGGTNTFRDDQSCQLTR